MSLGMGKNTPLAGKMVFKKVTVQVMNKEDPLKSFVFNLGF